LRSTGEKQYSLGTITPAKIADKGAGDYKRTTLSRIGNLHCFNTKYLTAKRFAWSAIKRPTRLGGRNTTNGETGYAENYSSRPSRCDSMSTPNRNTTAGEYLLAIKKKGASPVEKRLIDLRFHGKPDQSEELAFLVEYQKWLAAGGPAKLELKQVAARTRHYRQDYELRRELKKQL
jgi:hypothetical protein